MAYNPGAYGQQGQPGMYAAGPMYNVPQHAQQQQHQQQTPQQQQQMQGMPQQGMGPPSQRATAPPRMQGGGYAGGVCIHNAPVTSCALASVSPAVPCQKH